MSEKQALKRIVRTKSLTQGPTTQEGPSIIVGYVLDSKYDDGSQDSVPGEKTIKIKSLNQGSNIDQLAQQIIERCKYINESKTEALVNLLYSMQYKLIDGNNTGGMTSRGREELRNKGEATLNEMDGETRARADPVFLEDLDDYLEEIYDDDNAVKVAATGKILQLFRNPDNLDFLSRHETLLGSLSRVLREDSKKSTDLAVNIVFMYWTLSNFVQFHPILATHQAGLMCIKIIEHELKRAEVMQQEGVNKQFVKQERLLYVCIHVLLNLAADLNVEKKMLKKGLLPMLCAMLPRKNGELLILVVTFLKKLSVFRENKDALAAANVIPALLPPLTGDNEILTSVTLGLLLNLSFDPMLRSKMVEAGCIPRLVSQLDRDQHRTMVLRVLYHLSMDEAACSMFSYTPAIPAVLQLVFDHPDADCHREAQALAINLALNGRNADIMMAGDGLPTLVERCLQTHDPLLLKILRNIALHDDPAKKGLFAPFVVPLVKLAKTTRDPEVLVEVLGILGNCQIEGFDFAKLTTDFGLMDFLHKHLSVGSSEDDVILEAVILVGTLLSDPDVPEVLAKGPLIRDLFKVLQEKQDDPEILLQLCFVFQRLLLSDETRPLVITTTQAVYYLIELLFHDRPEVARLADACLDIVAETDEEWAKKIRQKRFEIHNAEWIAHVENEDDDDGHDDDHDMDDGEWEAAGLRRQKGFAIGLDEFDDSAWGDY